MPLFMDVDEQLPDGATALDVAAAHKADLENQYGAAHKQYWVDEANGKDFCLVEAPDADAAIGRRGQLRHRRVRRV